MESLHFLGMKAVYRGILHSEGYSDSPPALPGSPRTWQAVAPRFGCTMRQVGSQFLIRDQTEASAVEAQPLQQ